MERQRALLSQMHMVCSECEGHCWRGLGIPEIQAQQALPGAKQCSGLQAEEGTRWPTAPGVLSSCLDSVMLSLTACYNAGEKSSTGRFWLYTSWCLKEPESGDYSTAQKAATSLYSGCQPEFEVHWGSSCWVQPDPLLIAGNMGGLTQ